METLLRYTPCVRVQKLSLGGAGREPSFVGVRSGGGGERGRREGIRECRISSTSARDDANSECTARGVGFLDLVLAILLVRVSVCEVEGGASSRGRDGVGEGGCRGVAVGALDVVYGEVGGRGHL